LASVELHQVFKAYDKNVVVTDASVSIQDKEFIVLVGPSGCGKTTLLRMIAGLEDITDGTIRIGNKIVNEVAPKDRDIAMVFQNYALYPHMSVYENMAFGLRLRKFDPAEIDKRVQEAADILDIQHLLDRKPRALSGGQRQRVAVGRAIVRKPQVFLFDEPLSNLDAKLRVQMRTEISKLHNRLQTTMIYVTHDQVEAMTMGDRIVVMKDGVIQQVDSPLNLYDKPVNTFVAGFIGSPAMNFFDGEIIENGELFKHRHFEFKISESKKNILKKFNQHKLILGIRPEDFIEPGSTGVPYIPATVEVVEPMGNESYLYTRIGEQTITSRIRPTLQPEIGSEFHLGINIEKVHFFDKNRDIRIEF